MPQPDSISSRRHAPPADPTEDPADRSPRHRQSDEYTLKIVFSGIVPLVPEYDSECQPTRFWALVSNLTAPGKLPKLPGKDLSTLTPHIGRLLFDKKYLDDAGGRPVTPGELCAEGRWFDCIKLDNEDFELSVRSPTPLELITGRMVVPVPCDPTTPLCLSGLPQSEQEEDFGWAIDIDSVVQSMTPKGTPTPKLRQELLQSPYNPAGFPLLSSRFSFDQGRVTTHSFDTQRAGNFQISDFGVFTKGGQAVHRRTVATRIALTLQVQGPAILTAKPLDSTGTRLPIKFQNGGDADVVLYIDNHPDLPCPEYHTAHGEPHFLLNYCLYDDPTVLLDFPVPGNHPVGGPTLNAQCSPPRFMNV